MPHPAGPLLLLWQVTAFRTLHWQQGAKGLEQPGLQSGGTHSATRDCADGGGIVRASGQLQQPSLMPGSGHASRRPTMTTWSATWYCTWWKVPA